MKKEPMKRKAAYVLTLIRRSGIEKHIVHSPDQVMSWVYQTKDLLAYRVIQKTLYSKPKEI